MAIDSELGTSGASDAQLIEGLRFGSGEHQELLYRRHRQVALAVAYRHTDNPSEAEDIVSESFLRVFSLIRRGQGPTEFFRAYLLTAVSREAFARNQAASRQLPTDDLSQFEDGQDNADEVMQRAESKFAIRAFKTLPERWQAVLWHTEIDELAPRQVAPILGLSPNAVSALAVRAREGLREAYLAAHLNEHADLPAACASTREQLPRYVRGSAPAREKRAVGRHLKTCGPCHGVYLELSDVGQMVRGIILPLVVGGVTALGIPAAAQLASGSAAGAGTLSGSGAAASSGASGGTLLGTASGGALATTVGTALTAVAVVASAAGIAIGIHSKDGNQPEAAQHAPVPAAPLNPVRPGTQPQDNSGEPAGPEATEMAQELESPDDIARVVLRKLLKPETINESRDTDPGQAQPGSTPGGPGNAAPPASERPAVGMHPAESRSSPSPEQRPTTEPDEPSAKPDVEPTIVPSMSPTVEPNPETSDEPVDPTAEPSMDPTAEPTPEVSEGPTSEPSPELTQEPTVEPTADVTEEPTAEPTEEPTSEPSLEPSPEVSEEPTAEPTEPSAEVTEDPVVEPTEDPTSGPTVEPNPEVSEEPTVEPTEEPSAEPTQEPTVEPTEDPTSAPSPEVSEGPTAEPTEEPSAEVTEEPTVEPTKEPTAEPTAEPSPSPTDEETEELDPTPGEESSPEPSTDPSDPAPDPSDPEPGTTEPQVEVSLHSVTHGLTSTYEFALTTSNIPGGQAFEVTLATDSLLWGWADAGDGCRKSNSWLGPDRFICTASGTSSPRIMVTVLPGFGSLNVHFTGPGSSRPTASFTLSR